MTKVYRNCLFDVHAGGRRRVGRLHAIVTSVLDTPVSGKALALGLNALTPAAHPGGCMATRFEIQTLLEDGPELPAQLAEWLETELAPLTILLKRMQIPVCQRCGRCFLLSMSREGRYCSRECDRNEIAVGRVAFNGRSEPDTDGVGLPLEIIGATGPKSSTFGSGDPEFEIVWSGVGPLPGAGGAAGLGSTLSGIHFSLGRRV